MDAILLRRSVRKFKDELIPYEDLLTLCRYAEAAPSARNQRSREYIIIENKELIKNIAKYYPNSTMQVSEANQMIAVIGTKKDNLSSPAFQEQDLAYAAENLMIKATEMKIGSVMLGTYPVADRYVPVSKLLNLEEGKFPFTLICLGYPLSDDAFFDKNKFKPEMVKHIGE